MSIIRRSRKGGKHSYRVRVKTKTGEWITATFDKRKDAESYERDVKLKLSKNLFVTNESKKMTLNDYWAEWSANSRSNVSAGWKDSQVQMYRDYIAPVIGTFCIQLITGAHISRVLTSANDMGRSPQTVVHIYNLLNKMMSDAYTEYEYTHKNPVKKSLKPTVPKKEATYLSIESATELLKYSRCIRYGTAIWLQIYCGLRVGEVQVLKWDDVDLEGRTILVRSTYNRKEDSIQDYPKGKKWHTVMIPNELYELLAELAEFSTDGYVVETDDVNFMSYHSYRRVLKQYCKALELPLETSTHTLRHTTSQIYLNHGASRDDLQTLFAHSSSEVTSRYIHDYDYRIGNVGNIAASIKLLD